MSKQYCKFALVIIAYLNLINVAASIPLRPLISSTYKPSILLLPPGFESQKAPRQPMLYPYAVSSASLAPRATSKSLQTSTTTIGWIPVAGKDLPLIPTTPTLNSYPLPVLEDRISRDEMEYSSPSNNDGPVFESIVYGTWKPDPPLQPVEILNGTKQQQQHEHNSGLVVDGKMYNKTINRQHGGFIGHIQQKPTKADRQSLQKYKNEKLSSTSSSLEHKSKESTEMSSEQKLQRKLKKQGRQKIRPISSTTEQTAIERNPNREEATTTATTMTTTIENIQHQPIVIKVNSTDPKLMEVVKQINESIEMKYNHKQTSPHSIDVMTTASVNKNDRKDDNVEDYSDELGVLKVQPPTNSTDFMSTEPQFNYGDEDDDDVGEILENISATRRSWPTDFMDDSLDATDPNIEQTNQTNVAIDGLEADPSEIPLALSALNIPPSLWPKFPGNITKLGKPYETQSSSEEPALCVPITVREQNMINSKELVYIERVFCFPMPPSTTTSENSLRTTITGSTTTLRSATQAKVQNYNDFIDSTLRVTNSMSSSNFKSQLYLVTLILAVYFKFIV